MVVTDEVWSRTLTVCQSRICWQLIVEQIPESGSRYSENELNGFAMKSSVIDEEDPDFLELVRSLAKYSYSVQYAKSHAKDDPTCRKPDPMHYTSVLSRATDAPQLDPKTLQ